MSKLTRIERRNKAKEIRIRAAEIASQRSHPVQTPNEDEANYAIKNLTAFGNFSKGLNHSQETGLVTPSQYEQFVHALNSGASLDFATIPNHVSNHVEKFRKLTNPQAGLAFDLEGPDAQAHGFSPAPEIGSEQAAAEMAELYWMAVLRDTPFDSFTEICVLAEKAVADLGGNYEFFQAGNPGGGENGITTSNLFRPNIPGSRKGNLISQFLLIGNTDMDVESEKRYPVDGYIKYGAFELSQMQKSAIPGCDYLTDKKSWLEAQNGKALEGDKFLPHRRYITTPRDIATYVHFDALYEAYLNACWYLLNEKANGKPVYPFSKGNPYNHSLNQEGFGTYGGPHILSLVTEVATRALKCVWYQKWLVHRRLRPEAFGGRIDFHLKCRRTLFGTFPNEFINTSILDDLTDPQRLGEFFGQTSGDAVDNQDRKFENYFLPMAFPEGSPMHPSYGAGHATVAAACVTVLKAFFDETVKIKDPVQVDLGDLSYRKLKPLENQGDDLTVGGELDKLATNISVGRNMAGVHYWSDDFESRKLGEQIGIEILQEQSLTYNEERNSGATAYFKFTLMDGKTVVTIADGEVTFTKS